MSWHMDWSASSSIPPWSDYEQGSNAIHSACDSHLATDAWPVTHSTMRTYHEGPAPGLFQNTIVPNPVAVNGMNYQEPSEQITCHPYASPLRSQPGVFQEEEVEERARDNHNHNGSLSSDSHLWTSWTYGHAMERQLTDFHRNDNVPVSSELDPMVQFMSKLGVYPQVEAQTGHPQITRSVPSPALRPRRARSGLTQHSARLSGRISARRQKNPSTHLYRLELEAGYQDSETGKWHCREHPDMSFRNVSVLRRHLRETKDHSQAPWECDECKSPFSRQDALLRHQKSKHGAGASEIQTITNTDDSDSDSIFVQKVMLY